MSRARGAPLPISADEVKVALEGRYDVDRLIGTGGMASVFLARDLRHPRLVAIKVLHPDIAPVLDRFVEEISIVAQLTHPNIVKLYDSGSAGGVTYFVMPFMEGGSLRERLRESGPLPLTEAAGLMAEVAEALGYAHDKKGYVHRDIKPENILLESGHAVVADFGIARAVDAAASAGRTGSLVVGTPQYMSPEQAAGGKLLTGRSDVYTLGLVLYELLTGFLPAKTGSWWTRAEVRSTVRRIPRAIRTLIKEALAEDPETRPTAAAFATRLRAGERRGIPRIGTAALLTTLVAAAGVYIGVSLGTESDPDASIDRRRIVIVPLVNRTGRSDLDQLGPIAADWLIGGLQRTGIVEVVPTETAIEVNRNVTADAIAGDRRDPVKRLASETGAGMVVTGSYHLVGQSLRFHLQVADAIAGALVGAPDEVSASLADPIAGVGELRNRLMGWLAASYDERLKDLALGDHPPRYAAYVAFSEGMDRYIAVDIARATERFLAAHSLDSSFAMALLYGSISLSNQGDWRRADSVLRLIDPMRDRLSGYHRAWLDSRVAFVAGRNGEALAAIRRAAAMAPRSKAAYNHAVAAFQAGSLDEARAALDKLDPDRGPMRNFFPYWDVRAGLAHALGDYRREGADGRESRTRYPSRMAARLPTLRAVAATGDLASLGAALADAERLPADQRWWDRNLLHLEVAEELVAHRGLSQAVAAMAGSVSQLGGETPDERLVRARIEYTLGRWSQVATVLDQLPSDFAPIETLGLRGAIAARVGDTAAARAVMSQLARREEPYQFGASSLARARIAAVLGQPAEALALLRTAFAQGMWFDLWLHRDPDLRSLQEYPPFAVWLRSLRGGG